MVQETRTFIDQIVFQSGGGLKELLTATTTNPSRALATYYATGNMYTGGFPTPATDYASVTRPAGAGHRRARAGRVPVDARRLGHVVADQARPVHLLQAVLPAAPDAAAERAAARHDDRDDRHQHDARPLRKAPRRRDSCASCHKQFDPLGFGFEHFDEGGRYRAKEKTFDINSSGTITAPDGSTINFTDEQDLMTAVANQPIIHQCLSAYLAAYAYGSDEACLGASQVTALQSGSIGIAEAFARLAAEPHFTQRSSQ